MIVVDSSVWIDYFKGVPSRETDLLDYLLPRNLLLIGDLILSEVLQGFRREADFGRAHRLLDLLQFAAIGGYEVALASAGNYRLLRVRGVTVRKAIDVMIATFCIQNHHVLLHADRDFELMREPLGLVTF